MSSIAKSSSFVCIISILFLSACGIAKGGKKATGIEFIYDNNLSINYGYSFDFDTYLIFSNGKQKKVTGKDELQIDIEGASYRNGVIYCNDYPTSFQDDKIKVKATYSYKEKIFTKEASFEFNYLGNLFMRFNGEEGQNGMDGSNGSSSLLFRWGTDGSDGGMGGKGGNGADLTVHVWKDLNTGLYKMKVFNLITNNTYYYKTADVPYEIRIFVNGGRGGKGGAGGNGGDGKDGKKTDKKTKDPGNGGNGGNGGMGGTGGDAGNVYIFVHPNAAEIQGRFRIYNEGGAGGDGGPGGRAGSGGKALEGQEAATEGNAGIGGEGGVGGYSGGVVEIVVEEFDIEN